MKMTMSSGTAMTPRIHRKVMRAPSKLHPGKLNPTGKRIYAGKRHPGKAMTSGKLAHQQYSGKLIHNPHSKGKLHSVSSLQNRTIEMCDNSNDSGLGFDQHLEPVSSHIRNAPLRYFN